MPSPPSLTAPSPAALLPPPAAHLAHVALDGVGKRFPNGATVLDGVSLQVRPGDFVAVIGPSGCGKSTLLKLVSGLTAPTAGRILVDGTSPAAARATTSFIFQDPTLLPWRSVARNVGLGLELDGVPREARARKVAALLAFVGLEGVGGHFPRQLSGGMKMRVSIARALATTPRLLLMDEPFGALDEITRDRLNEDLLALRERDRWTALFVTHSVAEAVFLSNRVVVLAAHPGRVAYDLPVPFAYPRGDALRNSDAYQAKVLEVSRALRQLTRSPSS